MRYHGRNVPIVCPFCGLRYKQQEGYSACRGCPLKGSCSLVRCPNCGYEIPSVSGIVKLFHRERSLLDSSGQSK